MLELKNVSKFYSNKNIISVGFNKVSLKFDIGEFVAITGESGSGKSTLLNVISGLDSYEEGEMYINGKETSHYTEKDYEFYRKKYVGNIFQNFNLINSYSVYQNIELIFLLNGYKKSDIKNKVYELIDKVHLKKYKNTKVSKLSGGQKQKVAIARALALNTPIILADEPTGNLDKKSSENILELLYEISKDKLVIIVTHNYDQIEKYVTRKIIMSDGKIISDVKIKKNEAEDKIKENNYKEISLFNKLRLGVRNAFNIPSKFILILSVYLFVIFSLFFVYSSFKRIQNQNSMLGYNIYFNNISDSRIIIKKDDNSIISEEDYKKVNELSNVEKIIKNDYILDQIVSISNEEFYFNGNVSSIREIDKIDLGRTIEKDNEIVLYVNPYEYSINEIYDKLISNNFSIDLLNKNNYKIVGIIYNYDNYKNIFYISDNLLNEFNEINNKQVSKISFTFDNNTSNKLLNYELLPSDKVKKSHAIISSDLLNYCNNYDCINKKLNINIDSLYYEMNNDYIISDVYTMNDIKDKTGYVYEVAIFISDEDYANIFNKGNYQSSVFIKDIKNVRNTIEELENLGFKALYVLDTIYNEDNLIIAILNIVMLIAIVLLLLVLFYISYFTIKIVLNSRNIYYSTLRILGSSYKTTKSLLNIELLTLANLAYIIFIVFMLFIKFSIINNEMLFSLFSYVRIYDYIILYLILFIMTIILTFRYSRKLFKDTVMNSYKQEI